MQRLNLKSDYIGNFIDALDNETKKYLNDMYQKSFIPLLTGQNSPEMIAINSKFENKNEFEDSSDFCKLVRQSIINFQNDVLQATPNIGDFNRDFWEYRLEETFFLKLCCLNSIEKSDTLLKSIIALMDRSGNVKYPFFLNFPGLTYNKLMKEILNTYHELLDGKVSFSLDNHSQRETVQNQTGITDDVSELVKKNTELSLALKERDNTIDTLRADRNLWKKKFEKVMDTQKDLKESVRILMEERERRLERNSMSNSRSPSRSESLESITDSTLTDSEMSESPSIYRDRLKNSDNAAVELDSSSESKRKGKHGLFDSSHKKKGNKILSKSEHKKEKKENKKSRKYKK